MMPSAVAGTTLKGGSGRQWRRLWSPNYKLLGAKKKWWRKKVNVHLRTRRKPLATDWTWRTTDRETEAVTSRCVVLEKNSKLVSDPREHTNKELGNLVCTALQSQPVLKVNSRVLKRTKDQEPACKVANTSLAADCKCRVTNVHIHQLSAEMGTIWSVNCQ